MTKDHSKNASSKDHPTVEFEGRELPLYEQDANKSSYCPPIPYRSNWADRERCTSQTSLASNNTNNSQKKSHAESVSMRRTDSEQSLS